MPEARPGPVPELRFPEFRDAGPWEAKRLGDSEIARFIRERVAAEDVPLGHYVSTVNLLPAFCGLSPEPEKPPAGSAIAYREGDILMSNIRPYLQKVWVADRSGGASNDVLVARPSKSVVKSFLSQLLMSERFISHVMGGAKGVKMPRGDLEQIQDFEVPLPARPEQQKIADCLGSLDDLIRAEERRLEALSAHKAGLMQRLFPRPGETTPRLRFPEFEGAGPWEVKRLGDVGTISKGKGISKSDIKPDGALPCIRYGELYTLYGEVIHEVASSTDADPAGLVLSEENDVIIPASGETKEDIATASRVTISGVALGGDLNIFRSALNGAFLAYYVRGNLKSEISKVAQGDSVVHLYPTQLEKLKLAVPSVPKEQQKIADCLIALDDLIRAQGETIDALRIHKRGLMQKLFPREVG